MEEMLNATCGQILVSVSSSWAWRYPSPPNLAGEKLKRVLKSTL